MIYQVCNEKTKRLVSHSSVNACHGLSTDSAPSGNFGLITPKALITPVSKSLSVCCSVFWNISSSAKEVSVLLSHSLGLWTLLRPHFSPAMFHALLGCFGIFFNCDSASCLLKGWDVCIGMWISMWYMKCPVEKRGLTFHTTFHFIKHSVDW